MDAPLRPETVFVKNISRLLLLSSYVFLFSGASVHAEGQLTSREAVTASAFGIAGNFTLPEPAIINAYLRTNTSLKNHLLPSFPPLQLIKCEVYLLQMKSLFNFYTADHQGGCAEVPGMKRKPYEAYSEREKFWFFELRSSLCSWPIVLALVAVNAFYIYCPPQLRQEFL
jgi:hypothetical protein